MAANPVELQPVIRDVIEEVQDKRRMATGIRACEDRENDFASKQEMMLAGVAMVPEARQLMSDALTDYWARNNGQLTTIADYTTTEIVIGGGFHAAVYCANRVLMGFPRPVVLEANGSDRVGGVYTMSLNPVFRLNSRSRPGSVGLPDQDKALNYLPGGLIQPSMMSSEEYQTNAEMAWLIRLTLAQYAVVFPGVTVTSITTAARESMRVTTSAGTFVAGRVIDARGLGAENSADLADGKRILTFGQFMARMGRMFPLRGMQQVAVIGGGNSGLCAVESLLGIAPGHSSPVGLDYVQRVDLYANSVDGRTCETFRENARGRYIRIGQFLAGNKSNASTRLQVVGQLGYPSALPDGVLVNDRTYDMAIVCTGSTRENLDEVLTYFPVKSQLGSRARGTTLAMSGAPYQSYQIGPAADIPFSPTEEEAGISDEPASRVAMFRLAPRTAALAVKLPGLS